MMSEQQTASFAATGTITSITSFSAVSIPPMVLISSPAPSSLQKQRKAGQKIQNRPKRRKSLHFFGPGGGGAAATATPSGITKQRRHTNKGGVVFHCRLFVPSSRLPRNWNHIVYLPAMLLFCGRKQSKQASIIIIFGCTLSTCSMLLPPRRPTVSHHPPVRRRMYPSPFIRRRSATTSHQQDNNKPSAGQQHIDTTTCQTQDNHCHSCLSQEKSTTTRLLLPSVIASPF